jgi:transcriptional regulator with XRE-family HTH domain
MSITLTELGAEVARARKVKRLSQAELGRAAGLARQTISALERGAIPDLGVRKLVRLLEVLDLDLLVRPAGHPVTLDDLRPKSP